MPSRPASGTPYEAKVKTPAIGVMDRSWQNLSVFCDVSVV